MAIEIECECCKSTIRVRDELAGRTGLCRHCGSSITIPKPDDAWSKRLLIDATPEDMIKEINRRKQRGVLLLFDCEGGRPLQSGDISASNEQKAKLRTIGASEFDQRQLADIYRHLAGVAEQKSDADQALEKELQSDVFALKGDDLGMSLGDFKRKHARRVEGSGKLAPWCSDELPGQAVRDLVTESWHVAAGIVHARIDYPEENNPPTIAGVPTELVIYQFLDSKLFQITAFFGCDAFHQVGSALRTKFGAPHSEKGVPRRYEWWTMASTICLKQGSLRPPTPTVLSYAHDELVKLASMRKPDYFADL